MSRGLGTLITGIAAFAGGVVAGLLLTPKSGKENRQWIEDKSHRILEDGEKKIGEVSKNIKRSVKDNLPDLYEATELLHFEDEELEEDA
ncbi:MAG: YtxH domain-containing protein [Balneola sp.]